MRLERQDTASFAPPALQHACTAACLAPAAFLHHQPRPPKGSTPSVCRDSDNDDHQANNAFPVLPACCQRKTLLLIAPFPLHQLLTTQARWEATRDESMLGNLATKAGAIAWRGGAQSRPGKVACVMHFGRACCWWWAEGETFGARDRILPEAC